MLITKLSKEKLREALNLTWEVFDKFVAPDYGQEGIAQFQKFINYDRVVEKFERNEIFFWGCFDGDKMVGTAAVMKPFHIALLFVNGNYHNQGLAKKLFDKVLSDFHTEEKMITVNSSPYAEKVYKKLGFIKTEDEKISNGIRFIPMKKEL